MKLTLLLFLCQATYGVKQTLKFHLMVSFGIPNIPDYVETVNVQGVVMGYYDSSMKTGEPRQDWVRELIEGDPEIWSEQVETCINYQHGFKEETNSFIKHTNQTRGVHVIQQIAGCKWDKETGMVDGFKKYAYNGEDFLALDLDTETWTALNPQAQLIKQEWDGKKESNQIFKSFLPSDCPTWLKTFVKYGEKSLQRKVSPAVFLLQKTPSSPLRCHATGFYPDQATMFWRKDGVEVHEGAEPPMILPNHDGNFQMSVDLNISSALTEDWRRYECVFKLSGGNETVVTRLEKEAIRTNWAEKSSNMTIAIIVAVVVLAVIITGFIFYKRNKGVRNNLRRPAY